MLSNIAIAYSPVKEAEQIFFKENNSTIMISNEKIK